VGNALHHAFGFIHISHFISHFLLNQKEKSSSKTKHKKTEQRNNVEHEAIILKDKNRKNQTHFYCLMSVWVTRFNREGKKMLKNKIMKAKS